MVALAVKEFGKIRPVCFASTMLHTAMDASNRHDLVSAGTRLREATNRYLVAMCEYYDCTPKKRRDIMLARMSKNLLKAGGIDQGIFDWMKDIIEVGHMSAHCKRVSHERLDTAISLLQLIINNTPEMDFPTRSGGVL